MVFSGRESSLTKRALFAAALLAAAFVREGNGLFVDQAVIWFPSGVAVAGLWLLGVREWWVVAACAVGQRLLIGYGPGVALSAGAASGAEALLGAYLLRRLGFAATLSRLRDVLVVLVAAATAPAASIAASWLGRAFLWADPHMPFYSGWDGWWRMNALGILAVVPAAAVWLGTPAVSPRGRRAASAAVMVAGAAVGILLLLRLVPVSVTGVLLLVAVLPLSLYAGVRFGPRGAATAGALAAIVVALGTGWGLGPFRAIERSDRHAAVQVFELLLLAMPLALGVLVAERETAQRTTAFEARVLGLVATGRPAPEIFAGIVAGIEELTGGLCSILLLTDGRMNVAAAPSLPPELNAALDGVMTGPEVGSCGAAAHRGATVIVEDLATDPLWAAYRQFALPHGIRACWATPVRSSTGSVLGVFAVYYRRRRKPDRADQALAERAGALAGIAVERERRIEALRRSEDLLASINRNVSEGLYRRAAGGGLLYVNPAFARMFGYDTSDDAVADPGAMSFVDPERRAALEGALAESGRVVNEEVRFRRRDGTVFWGLVSIARIHDDAGVPAHEDGVVADVTERKALEDQFRQAQKMEAVGKLAGGVAHDFNNLLTVVIGYADEIRAACAPGDPLSDHAREIQNAARRGASLTRQLLAYSRQQLLRPQVLDLTEVVDELGGMLRRLLGEDIRLATVHASGRLWVRVDRSQLEQAVVNLAVNAREAMPAGGKLTVETSGITVAETPAAGHAELQPGSWAALSVRDTGVGMTPEVHGRAFDPFFTTKGPGKGSGLGLSTVYGIVKQSGGAVRLESGVARGTTAWIYLPRLEEPGAPVTGLLGEVAPGPIEGTILLAEDEPAVRMLAKEVLGRAGYRVLEAEDGEEALAISRAHGGTLDLLVTDIVMPNLGGRELAACLLEERPGVRVLFMSGYPDAARDFGELQGSAGDLLRKPFSLKELVERVHSTLSPRGATVPGPLPA